MRLPQAGPQRCSKGLGLALTTLLHVGAAWQVLQGQALFPLHLRGMRQMSRSRGCPLGPLPAPSPNGLPSSVHGTGSALGTDCSVGAAGCTLWPPAPWPLGLSPRAGQGLPAAGLSS